MNFTPHSVVVLCFSLLSANFCAGQTTTMVSVDSSGGVGNDLSAESSVSADGRYVAFKSSSSNLVSGDTNGFADIFVRDTQTGITERVSVDSFGLESNGGSWSPSISSDGRYVVFESDASNLVSGDTNNRRDVFRYDRQAGVMERMSVDSSGAEGDNSSWSAALSADGLVVTFQSRATNLVAGDTNGFLDVFVRDTQTGITERVSVDTLGMEGNGWSTKPALSGDGFLVSFMSNADNFVSGDTNGSGDVFVHDRQTGVTERVSVSSSGVEALGFSGESSLSGDGRYVAFESEAGNLVSGDSNGVNDIFVRDRLLGTTERVSVNSFGSEASFFSEAPALSSDGRYVVFSSFAFDLVSNDHNNINDIFVHDLQTGTTERVSLDSFGAEGTPQGRGGGSLSPAISADGRYVTFQSDSSNLVPGDTNPEIDIFIRDRWDGLGANTIYLSGPSSLNVGLSMFLKWYTAPSSSTYWLLYSTNTNGLTFSGHSFDLGTPATVMATGTNGVDGFVSYISPLVPTSAAGITLYFEVASQDANGLYFDSNVLAVSFL